MAKDELPCCEPMFWTYLIICVVLVSFAGLMSGLTLAFMSLSLVDLEVIIKAGQPQDRKNAAKILPIVKNQHLLLCTLVLGNAMAIEALPIFLDALVPALGAILISVTLVISFCEIIPHAVCSRYGLSVGAKLSAVVWLIIIVLFPLAYPISKLLDWFFGKKHSALFGRAELKTLVDMHGKEAGKGGELSQHETTIINGALDMTLKTAKDAMSPLSKIFSLDINSKLDEKTMGLIESAGHSRVPIYSGNPANIIGLILVKNLIKIRPDDETPVREITIRKIPRVHDHLPLYDILNQFQIGYSHMAVVVKCTSGIKELKEETKSECSMFKTNINNQNSEQRKPDKNICIHSLSVYSSSDTEIEPPNNVRNLRDCLHPNFKKSKCQDQNLSNEDLESLPAASDEEVIGIITLEDVMEELLQEEILDETDHVYVDVHNKIKLINMVASRRSPLIRSPIAASASHIQWPSPGASPVPSNHQSPLSSSYNTPILHSPILPYVRSPLIRPTLYASPGKFVPNSPTKLAAGAVHYSPSSHRVSRKSYQKLRKPEELP